MPSKNDIRAFNAEHLKYVDYSKAIILHYLNYFLESNKKAQKGYENGTLYTYTTTAKMLEKLYWYTEEQLNKELAELQEAGWITIQTFTKRGSTFTPGTRWYGYGETWNAFNEGNTNFTAPIQSFQEAHSSTTSTTLNLVVAEDTTAANEPTNELQEPTTQSVEDEVIAYAQQIVETQHALYKAQGGKLKIREWVAETYPCDTWKWIRHENGILYLVNTYLIPPQKTH